MGRRGQGEGGRLAHRPRSRGGALPGRTQRRTYPGDRRQEDRSAPGSLGHPQEGHRLLHRQRRGAVAPGADQGDGRAGSRRRGNRRTPAHFGGLSTDIFLPRGARRGAGIGEKRGKIGTTGRGIGPAYEDKIARRAIRLQDLLVPERFSRKLEPLLDYHNFVLTKYLGAKSVDFAKTCDETLALAPRLKPLVADVSRDLHAAAKAGKALLFEGAQGALLDVDHGTYPYVTSSNCVAGTAAAGAGIGPQMLHYVLRITKAYTTRVGARPVSTELGNAIGELPRKRGDEIGRPTGPAPSRGL